MIPSRPAEVYVGGYQVQLPEWQAWAKAAKAELEMLLGGEAEAA